MAAQRREVAGRLERELREERQAQWMASLRGPGWARRAPRCTLVANAGGRPFCQELGMGWVHIGQWIFSISALSHELFWRNCVFCVFTL